MYLYTTFTVNVFIYYIHRTFRISTKGWTALRNARRKLRRRWMLYQQRVQLLCRAAR